MDTQIQGTVKFFNEEKGFGFIIDQIEANDRVVFDVQEGRKGPNAVNVKRLA